LGRTYAGILEKGENIMKKCLISLVLIISFLLGLLPVGVMAGDQLPRVTVHMIGDSTVCNYASLATGITGWGQAFDSLLSGRADLNNMAISGASTTSFIEGFKKADGTYTYSERWSSVLKSVKAGDFLFIQFGHNDQKTGDPDYVYASAALDKYKANLTKMVNEAKGKGATPVLVTSPERMSFFSSGDKNTLGGYPAAMIEVSSETGTKLIDLHALSVTYFESIGEAQAATLFVNGDITHFNAAGALQLAKIVAGGLDAPLTSYIDINSTKEIFYPTTYLEEDFSLATTDTASHKLVTNHGRVLNNAGPGADNSAWETKVYEEENGNKSFEYRRYAGAANGLFPYFTFSDAVSAGYVVTEFDIMLKSYTSNGNKNTSAYFELQNSGWQRKNRIYFLSRQVNGIDTVYLYIFGSNEEKSADRQLSLASVYQLAPNEWNSVKLITDTTEKKTHVFVNEKLVATDIPDSKNCGSAQDIKHVYFSACHDVNQNNVAYLDNVKVYTISEDRVVQSLMDGLDAFIGDEIYTGVSESKQVMDINFPGSARISGMTNTVDLYFGSGLSVTVRPENYSSLIIPATTTSPYKIVSIYRPYGYQGIDWVGQEGKRTYFTPVITVGTTANAKGDLITKDIKVKRTLLPSLTTDMEIGKPKLLNVADPDISALPSVASFRSAKEDLWTQTAIANNSGKTKNVMVMLVIYSNNTVWYVSYSKTEIGTGDTALISSGSLKAAEANAIPDDAAIKYVIWDADTLTPLTVPLECK
jgi:lysophospholipase L1-like esterase